MCLVGNESAGRCARGSSPGERCPLSPPQLASAGGPRRCPSVQELDPVLFDHGVGQHLVRDGLDVLLRLLPGNAGGDLDVEELALPHPCDRVIPEAVQGRACPRGSRTVVFSATNTRAFIETPVRPWPVLVAMARRASARAMASSATAGSPARRRPSIALVEVPRVAKRPPPTIQRGR